MCDIKICGYDGFLDKKCHCCFRYTKFIGEGPLDYFWYMSESSNEEIGVLDKMEEDDVEVGLQIWNVNIRADGLKMRALIKADV